MIGIGLVTATTARATATAGSLPDGAESGGDDMGVGVGVGERRETGARSGGGRFPGS